MKFAEKIVSKKGDSLFALKGNQEHTTKKAMNHFYRALRHLKLEKANCWSIHQDASTIKSLPKKHRETLLNHAYQESVFSLVG